MIHAGGLAVLPFTAIPPWAMALLAVIELSALHWSWPRHASRRCPDAVRLLVWEDGDQCVVTRTNGTVSTCRLAPHAFVMPWLVVIYFRRDRDRYWQGLFILPDMLPSETFRRLRVRLRTATDPSVRAARA